MDKLNIMDKTEILRKYSGVATNTKMGNLVVVVDGSYILSIVENTYELTNQSLGSSEEVYKIIAINVSCPTYQPIELSNVLRVQNNCIIKSLVDDSIHFCSKINIKKVVIPDLTVLDGNNINIQRLRDKTIDKILEG
jgi:hypothetical protein